MKMLRLSLILLLIVGTSISCQTKPAPPTSAETPFETTSLSLPKEELSSPTETTNKPVVQSKKMKTAKKSKKTKK